MTEQKPSLRSLGRRLAFGAVDLLVEGLDPDRALVGLMEGFVHAARQRYPFDPGAQWRPGEPLRLLLAGYSGTRNTGADVRVEEMIRQFRHLFGEEHLQLSLLTIDPEGSRRYFAGVRQLHLPQIFPRFLFDTVHDHHGVIACEGSMFKSKFASALATMMAGALGLAAAEQKIAVGYGGEAGAMEPYLERFVRRACRDAYVIARNEASCDLLHRLGLRADPGTDTAWTYEPAPDAEGRRILREHGWDEHAPVLLACPIDPFWWPVRPSPLKAARHALLGAHHEAHYASIYFHREGEQVERSQSRYLDALAGAIGPFARRHGLFVACVGMERLDRGACEALAERLGGAPVLVSDAFDAPELVSVLRQARYLVSSRYHAIVTSMPAAVPSVGVTMDERIANLMVDRGQPELALRVDQPDLQERLAERLQDLHERPEAHRTAIEQCVAVNLERMGHMGQLLVEHVRREHLPEFPFRKGLGLQGSPWDHLPPLSGSLRALLERNASPRERMPGPPFR